MVDSKNSPIYYIVTSNNQNSREILRKYENGKNYFLTTNKLNPFKFEFSLTKSTHDKIYENKLCVPIDWDNLHMLDSPDCEFMREILIKDVFPLDL